MSYLKRYLGVLGGLEEESYQSINILLPPTPRGGGVFVVVALALTKLAAIVPRFLLCTI